MKRSPLTRKTPMKRGTSTLKRTAMKVSRVPIPKTGKRSKAATSAMLTTIPIVSQRSGGRCEFNIMGVCSGPAEHMHHRQLRRFGDHSPENVVAICHDCHAHAHANPTLSYRMGWLVRSTDVPALITWAGKR